MARNFARIYTRIWHDREFRDLKLDAQHAYFAVLSHPDLSHVGVTDYIPQRLAGLSADGNARRSKAALDQLRDARFIVIDETTAELCVRSLVRLDGIFDRKNMGKAAARHYAKVLSLDIREQLIDEMARHYADHPDAPGWEGFYEIDPDGFEELSAMASRMASGM